jgi:hypothetical protein
MQGLTLHYSRLGAVQRPVRFGPPRRAKSKHLHLLMCLYVPQIIDRRGSLFREITERAQLRYKLQTVSPCVLGLTVLLWS